MTPARAGIVICGAGIAGISAAYQLAVRHGQHGVVLVDERPPLSLTSDKSTECYRNWWPGRDGAMIALMNRSIELLEGLARVSGNAFGLNRRGYVYATADPACAEGLAAEAMLAERQGAGPLRVHDGRSAGGGYLSPSVEGFEGQPGGADLITDRRLIRDTFPYLSERVVAVLHARRCGWLSAHGLGMQLLERARRAGVRLVRARVEGVELVAGHVSGVRLRGAEGERILPADAHVAAAGPLLREVAGQLGIELPVHCELHLRASARDVDGAMPRDAPLLVWADPQVLPWSEADRRLLSADPACAWLLEPLPPGVHVRPEGGSGSQTLLALWGYHTPPVAPQWPPAADPLYPEVVLRGVSTMVPGLSGVLARGPRPFVDGGYYTRTPDNRPLIGPLPVPGAYVLGALSGYGIMAACAAGELLASHVTGAPLPDYAAAFSPGRAMPAADEGGL